MNFWVNIRYAGVLIRRKHKAGSQLGCAICCECSAQSLFLETKTCAHVGTHTAEKKPPYVCVTCK